MAALLPVVSSKAVPVSERDPTCLGTTERDKEPWAITLGLAVTSSLWCLNTSPRAFRSRAGSDVLVAGTFQLSAAVPRQGDRGAVVAAGLLYRLMDFQHYKSHGLTEVRVRLSGQHQFLPFTCPRFGWALRPLLL